MKEYIIALDQGTTSSRAMLFDPDGKIQGIAQQEFTQIFPKKGWVEHDPAEIWKTQLDTLNKVCKDNKVSFKQIRAIGITNQRETAVLWDKQTGQPVYNAIVWQDQRTIDYCERFKEEGLEKEVRQKTGLLIDTYFSATKVKWILEQVPEAKKLLDQGRLAFGTIDSWLIWNLTGGKVHATDLTNASRTMLFNINTLKWDTELLEALGIPDTILPAVYPSASEFGHFEIEGHRIPIAGVAGDQQAALFGQACFEKGMAKNTYGTGCFLLMNIGQTVQRSESGLLTTIAWGLDGAVEYALEGSVFIAGAAIQWLRDSLKIIDEAKDSEYYARKVSDTSEVVVVPAFAGLGAPYWDMYAKGAIFGLTRDTQKEHIIKATIESMAFQSRDILQAMEKDSGIQLKCLNVDGGATANNYLMQFQADILNVPVERPLSIESTARGAAYLAGMQVGSWSKADIRSFREEATVFNPQMENSVRDQLYSQWLKAIERTKGWSA